MKTRLDFDIAVERIRQQLGFDSFDDSTEGVLELLSRNLFGRRVPEETGEGYRALVIETARGSKPRVTA